MKRTLKWLASVCLLGGVLGSVPAKADALCEGNFVNPITDICWDCLFPMTIGKGLPLTLKIRPCRFKFARWVYCIAWDWRLVIGSRLP